LSSEVVELRILIDSIQLPTTLPPIPQPPDSAQRRSYSTHLEKQDYHAHNLAQLLTSLAKHYEQTASALKDHESTLGQPPTIDPETHEVLSRDASEVSEVLEEMEDHVRELEHSSDILQTHAQNVQEAYSIISNTFSQIEEYGKSRLPIHLSSVRTFESRATTHREHIQTLKQEMFNLVEYYTNFSTAYEALVGEVQRRTEAQIHISILVNEITSKLENLYEQETRARQSFMDAHAAFLPEDLWRGIYDPPIHATIRTDDSGALPVLRDATKRLSSTSMERRRSGQPMQGSGESSGRKSMETTGRKSAEVKR
jgi:autophagy-related protein 17